MKKLRPIFLSCYFKKLLLYFSQTDTPSMEKQEFELLLKFYESSRQEIIARITARDNTLLVNLGAVAAILGASFQVGNTLLLLIIPYLTLGVTLIVSHHNDAIMAVSTYCNIDLGKAFQKYNITVSQWETSSTRQKYGSRTFLSRHLGNSVILLTPSIYSLVVVFPTIAGCDQFLLLTFASFCCFTSGLVIIRSMLFRNKLQKQNLDFYRQMLLSYEKKV